jgi:hypothetical protein
MIRGLTGFRAEWGDQRRHAVVLAAILSVLAVVLPSYVANADSKNPAGSSSTGDQTSIGAAGHQEYHVRGPVPAPSEVASATDLAPEFSFTFNSPDYPWTSAELTQLQAWTAPGSAPMTVLAQVAGAPKVSSILNISHDPTIPAAGYYYPGVNKIVLGGLRLSVLLHELNHAVHGSWIMGNAVWEEGMARAAEMREMGLLAAQGIIEEQYDLHHSYSYDRYYENTNSPDIGVADGSIWGNGAPALPLLRYEQSGYAFGKVLIDNADAIKAFNAKLFQQPNGSLPHTTLVNMLAEVQPAVEAVPTSTWVSRQGILNPAPPTGCRLVQRVSQFTVDFFCRQPSGVEVAQVGATVRLDVYDATDHLVYTDQQVTTGYGWASFSGPPLTGSYQRLRLVASAASPAGTASATYYRPDTPFDESGIGVFGVVTNVTSGTVTFSSPDGRFATFTVPVARGGFSAPSLTGVRGQVEASFSGGGLVSTRRFNKDASPYSMVITPQAPTCGLPGAPAHGFYTPSALTPGTSPTAPVVTAWTAANGSGCTYELQRQDDTGGWTTVYSGSARTFTSRVGFGIVPAFRVRSVDPSGTSSDWALSTMSTLDGIQESSAAYTSTFVPASSASYWDGTVKFTMVAGASASISFDGQSIALVGTKCRRCGSLEVYLDGALTATVSASSSTTQYRQIVAQWAGASGRHLLKVVNVAPAGQPALIVDGFAVFR